LPVHCVLLRHRAEPPAQLGQPDGRVGDLEVHPEEEPVGEPIVELLALQDVPGLLQQEAGHRVHQPGAVRAGQDEDELPAGERAR
jgi:hypothetical protein